MRLRPGVQSNRGVLLVGVPNLLSQQLDLACQCRHWLDERAQVWRTRVNPAPAFQGAVVWLVFSATRRSVSCWNGDNDPMMWGGGLMCRRLCEGLGQVSG